MHLRGALIPNLASHPFNNSRARTFSYLATASASVPLYWERLVPKSVLKMSLQGNLSEL